MNKLLLPLLIGCTDIPEECQPQLDRTEQACQSATVIGANPNEGLYTAIDELKACVGEDVKVICSNPGYGEPKILTVSRR